MGKRRYPVTPAVRALRTADVDFEPALYDYQPRGGASRSAEVLGVDPHAVVKTLIFEDQDRMPLVVLMHGDRRVSTGALARQLGAKSVRICSPAVADKHSGYQVGGTSPFGTRERMPVFVERSVLDLKEIWVNGGKRGFLVRIDPAVLSSVLKARAVDVAG